MHRLLICLISHCLQEQHFTTDHYPCTQATCLEKKFVVFDAAIDLQAHMVDEHGTTMTVKDKKDARRIATEFQFEDSRQNRPGDRRRGQTERERDREPPPGLATTRPPDRRRAGFGAALTSEGDASGSSPASGANTPHIPSRPRSSSPARENVDPAVAQYVQPILHPHSRAIVLTGCRKHAEFMARVSALTSGSAASEASIKAAIRSFRASESAAQHLITTFYVVLDSNVDRMQTLINPLVDILDSDDKKKDLLETWNGFKLEVCVYHGYSW